MSYSWFQTNQTGSQQYSDTSPFSIPCSGLLGLIISDEGKKFYSIGTKTGSGVVAGSDVILVCWVAVCFDEEEYEDQVKKL